MKNRINNLTIEFLGRKKYKKIETKKILLKCIINTKNIELKKKIFFTKLLDKTKKFNSIVKQNSMCIHTGRAKGIVNLLGLSRHSTKRYGLQNKLPNIRVGSW
jgi:ribosomal protein S14